MLNVESKGAPAAPSTPGVPAEAGILPAGQAVPAASPAGWLAQLNQSERDGFVRALDGIYEHSPWVAQRAHDKRPFASAAALKRALVEAVAEAGREAQAALIHAHPELAGRAAVDATLTPESAAEQRRAGLTRCTPEELAEIRRLNAAYQEKFGHPFILAVRGPDGAGLSPPQIAAALARRLRATPAAEFAEALRQIHRIAEVRLSERFGLKPAAGLQVLDWADRLAAHTETPGALTVTYGSAAHRAAAQQLCQWMRESGFDEAGIDAVGNVVGRYRAAADAPAPRTLLTGSHYDTVRNGGKFDGRLGILAPMAAVRRLHAQGRRLPFDVEVVGFAEEEGVRFSSTFLGSAALAGRFDAAMLALRDAQGVTMGEAMRAMGGDPDAIGTLARDPSGLLGYVEIHIEQGPVLLNRDLPLGVVSSINGSVRMTVAIDGVASHAGTTPMDMRFDAACAAAEWTLEVERRASAEPALVGTVGKLAVPEGSINVVPGRCELSLDVRAPTDAQRDAAVSDLVGALESICARRGVPVARQELLRAAAAPSDAALKARWARAVERLGVPVYELPSGAGHDAMKMAELCPQAMLFVRCGNGGISHNPLETMTADDADLAVAAFIEFLNLTATETDR